MGNPQSKTKYALLYGNTGSGKTLMQYSMQTSLKVFDKIESTEGFNYEEYSTEDNLTLGIFDVSGDPKQYEVVNIVTKSITISGIIFLINMETDLTKLDQSKDLLKLILGNNYLTSKISLLVIYNLDSKLKDRLSWMDEENLNERLNLKKIQEKYRLKSFQSCITNVTEPESDNFKDALTKFVKLLFQL